MIDTSKYKELLSRYVELLTIFSVVLAVEYSNTSYDVWDLFLGIVVVIVSYKYLALLRDEKNFTISFLTSMVFSLGIVTIIGSIVSLYIDLTIPFVHTITSFQLYGITTKFILFITIICLKMICIYMYHKDMK